MNRMNSFLLLFCVLLSLQINQSSCKTIVKRSNSGITCGVAETVSVGLIYGGGAIARKQHPWKVALYRNDAGKLTYICGGVVIDKNSVVTGKII